MEENRQYAQEYKVQAVRLAKEIGLSHSPKRKPNGTTKMDRKACKSNALLKRDFQAANPLIMNRTGISQTYVESLSCFSCIDNKSAKTSHLSVCML